MTDQQQEPDAKISLPTNVDRRMLIAQIVAWLVGLAIVIPFEWERINDAIESPVGLFSWFVGINADTTLPFLLLLIAPAIWLIRSVQSTSRRSSSLTETKTKTRSATRTGMAIRAVVIFVIAIFVQFWVANYKVPGPTTKRFGELPPAYHDEYSYLFQAETFLSGRLWYPSHSKMPRLFDQMHVLNEGRFASRYFPGNGLWIAPFLSAGHPHWGHWLAAGLCCVFVLLIGYELGDVRTGTFAGLLTAVSPGIALFGNLLLAHLPTLAALMLFVWSFLRMMRNGSVRDGLLAGIGLSFAMLTRPMTAAGIGLPFGLWLLLHLGAAFRRDAVAYRIAARMTVSVGFPVLVGVIAMLAYNRALTGSMTTMPYQQYTEIYTPRHIYGFNNVVRGEKLAGDKVIEEYDRWAENLTPELALRNVGRRFLASWQWTLGVIPLVMGGIVFLIVGPGNDRRWWLIPATIVSLHLVHVPYWYDGILHWHYVFETCPFWLLVFSCATWRLCNWWKANCRFGMPAWWYVMMISALAVVWMPAEPFWKEPRIELGVGEIGFSRLAYERFHQLVEAGVLQRPALVLIEANPADRHIDYVVNHPSLNSDILYGRYRDELTPIREVRSAFPKRAIYIYDAKTNTLLFLLPAETSK